MDKKITCFLPAGNPEDLQLTLDEIKRCGQVGSIYLLVAEGVIISSLPAEVQRIDVPSLFSSETFRKIALHANNDFTLLYTKSLPLQLGVFALQRMIQVAEYTLSGMVYSDYYALKQGQLIPNPIIEYQEGSLRDDFNFGSLLLFESTSLIEAASRMKENYSFSGLYDLRLKISQRHNIFHIPELLYTEVELDTRKSGEKLFDYVDPKNRQVQIEMEQTCTVHLKDIGAWLEPRFARLQFNELDFDAEVSVIIPVKNRAKTIRDAISSVLNQKTSFIFNLILVDNHSSDGTGRIIRSFSSKDKRVIHIIPERNDLGIGGCWNEAVFHQSCGKFAVQLDSDDLYIDNTVLSRIVDAFYEQNCAMLVGSYRMVNFNLEEIPPGLIDHREWTPENGRNNALRINGLGAPRAFYTPVIRSVRVPNVSYGEDYALGLTISRYYQIGRIYEPLYLCRRWEENSDASLDIQKMNAHNFYKDKIRTIELWARQQYIQEGQEV
jgi:hypothetical protein